MLEALSMAHNPKENSELHEIVNTQPLLLSLCGDGLILANCESNHLRVSMKTKLMRTDSM